MAKRRGDDLTRILLLALLIFQALTHLFWLSPAAHSGQAAIPWMMNRGMTLFRDIWEQHAPGSSLLGALAQAVSPFELDITLRLMNTALVLALTLAIFELARRLGGDRAGLLAAAVWVWWAPTWGNIMLYFDTLLSFCVVLALLVYWWKPGTVSPRRIVMAGLLMGAATLFKQHAWLALLVFGGWLVFAEGRRVALLYGLSALCLPLVQWLILGANGTFDSYLYWNWTFNLSGTMDGVRLDGDLFRKLLLCNVLVFPFALEALHRKRYMLPLILMWLATLTLLYPRFGEIHAMGHLPFTALMSGLAVAWVLPELKSMREWDMPRAALAGMALGIGMGWLWTGAVTYIPWSLGPGATLGYDEFDELVAELGARQEAGDTLFVLPQTDSTPQLHPRTGMPPPGTWIKGWRWYFRPDFVLPALLDEWESAPPTWMVVFPLFITQGESGIDALLEFTRERYELRFTVDDIFDHGAAQVYRLSADAGT